MSHAPVMRSAAIVAAVFGLALLLAPNALMAIYGSQPLAGPGLYNTLLYGGFLIGYAVMNWMAAEGTWREVRAIVAGGVVGNGLCLLAALWRQFSDTAVPPTAWLNIVIFAVFAALFAWVYAKEMREPLPHAAQPG